MRSGIGLATGWGGNVGMADAVLDRVCALERPDQVRQYFRYWESANGWSSAPSSSIPIEKSLQRLRPRHCGLPGMPGAPGARDELDQFAVATYQEVAGNLVSMDFAIVRVVTRVEAVGEQFDDAGAAELARRKADAVNDQQFDLAPPGLSSQFGEDT